MDGEDDDYNEFIRELDDSKKPDSGPNFFKILVGNFQDFLRFPRQFVATSPVEFGSTIFLIGPSKNRWRVELSKEDGDVFMTKGWCCFAKDHNLSYGHFLLFTQLEVSAFQVKIFNASAVEVKYRFSVVNGSGGACQGIYCLHAQERDFNIKYEMQIAHIKGVRISNWSFNAPKEELHARHMAIWGNKNDLVCRLQLAVVVEKLARNYPDYAGDIETESNDESDSEVIIISDSEDDVSNV